MLIIITHSGKIGLKGDTMLYVICIVFALVIILLYAEIRILNNRVSLLQDLVTKQTIPTPPSYMTQVSEEDAAEQEKKFREADREAVQKFRDQLVQLNAFMTGQEDIGDVEQQ